MYKRLADFFFRMTFNHVHFYQNLKKNSYDQTICKYNLLKKTFTLLLNTKIIYRDQTLMKFVY